MARVWPNRGDRCVGTGRLGPWIQLRSWPQRRVKAPPPLQAGRRPGSTLPSRPVRAGRWPTCSAIWAVSTGRCRRSSNAGRSSSPTSPIPKPPAGRRRAALLRGGPGPGRRRPRLDRPRRARLQLVGRRQRRASTSAHGPRARRAPLRRRGGRWHRRRRSTPTWPSTASTSSTTCWCPSRPRRWDRPLPTGSLHLHRTDGPGEWLVRAVDGDGRDEPASTPRATWPCGVARPTCSGSSGTGAASDDLAHVRRRGRRRGVGRPGPLTRARPIVGAMTSTGGSCSTGRARCACSRPTTIRPRCSRSSGRWSPSGPSSATPAPRRRRPGPVRRRPHGHVHAALVPA